MVKPKKHLGQHFLKDLSVAEKISDSLQISTPYLVEVGPGTGVLTQYLLKKNIPLVAFEVDAESVDYLNTHFKDPNLTVVTENFLHAPLPNIIPAAFNVIGNFPYNISSQIIFKVLKNKIYVPQVVGMFQKEVAQRICAPHGNKTYGVISVLTQLYYKPEYLFTVSEEVFYPPPKVKSGVIRLTRYRTSLGDLEPLITQIVKAGFNQRRKKLSNSLKTLTIPVALKNHKFLNLRAEQLSIEDFLSLAKTWYEHKT